MSHEQTPAVPAEGNDGHDPRKASRVLLDTLTGPALATVLAIALSIVLVWLIVTNAPTAARATVALLMVAIFILQGVAVVRTWRNGDM